jgi:nucleoside-diphosphate-sugar epimerase
LYAVAKHSGELLARTLRDQYRLDVVSVRLGHIYGLNERSRPTRPNVSAVAHLLQAALAGQRLSIPADSPAVDWTFAGDIGRAFAALLAAPALPHDLYHVTAGEGLTLRDIAHAIQRLLPETTVEISDNPSAFRGRMIATRLAADTGFTDWTPFLDGLRQTLDSLRQPLETRP